MKRFHNGEASHRQEERSEDCEGTVKWFYEDRGHGFIAPAQGGRDIVVGRRRYREAGHGGWMLRKGQRVSYREAQGLKGKKAVNVRVETRGPERERDRHEQRDGWGDHGQWADSSDEVIMERIRMAAFAVSCRVYGKPPEEWSPHSEEGVRCGMSLRRRFRRALTLGGRSRPCERR